MPFSSEAERQMAANAARHRGNQWMRGEAELLDPRFGARTIGAIAEIGPGWEIWTAEGGRRNWHEEPLGGIVLHVDSGGQPYVDAETGEIVHRPASFRCYDPLAPWPNKAFVNLAEGEVNAQAVTVADNTSMVIAIRRFCRQVADGPKTLGTLDAQLVIDAARLVAVVMGGP